MIGLALLLIIAFIVGCGSTEKTEPVTQEPQKEESQLANQTESKEENTEENEDATESKSESPDEPEEEMTDDNDVKQETSPDGSYTWSRAISYNEIIEIYDYYVSLDSSVQPETDEEADADVWVPVEEMYDITEDDLAMIILIIKDDDRKRINQKYYN